VDDIGVFNGAFGADTFGFRNLKRVNWLKTPISSTSHPPGTHAAAGRTIARTPRAGAAADVTACVNEAD
jgi:hypothetical protein